MQVQINYVNEILVFVIFAVSLNLLMGYAGQVSVASAAFGAIGGYGTAYLWLNHHLPLLLDLLIALGIAAAVGLIVGIPALRLNTVWLILLTLAVQTIVVGLPIVINALGGANGLSGITGLTVFGQRLTTASDQLPLFAILTVLAFLVCWRFAESPYGRVLRGIREDETATRALGKSVTTYKLTVFAISSAIAGVAGALLVVQQTVVEPSTFSFDQSTEIIAMVIFGGMANLWGSVVGAAIIVLTTPFLEYVVNLPPDSASQWQLVIYGALIFVVMRLRPQGVIPEGARLSRLWTRKPVPVVFADDAPRAVPTATETVFERNEHRGELILQVRDLSKSFGGIVAASDVALDLHRGTITALVGSNGAGKTTILNLLTGAIRPDSGSVRLKGVELAGFATNRIANMGLVRSFQDVRVLPRLTALENVMLAVQDQPGERALDLFTRPGAVGRVERATRERALEWLDFVGQAAVADSPAGSLGFGQQKLVALARVLATEAEVLLLDEPASGIDQNWVEVMIDLIGKLRPQGRTVLLVEHNLHVVGRLADYAYFLELGRITAHGAFEELTSDRRLAEAYFGSA